MKLAHPKLSLKEKHLFYLIEMELMDVENNKLKRHIRWLSSESDQVKDRCFYKHIADLKEKLQVGRELREKYRSKVRRLKETIKNEHRHLNNGIESLR
jgi:hypothetical protein